MAEVSACAPGLGPPGLPDGIEREPTGPRDGLKADRTAPFPRSVSFFFLRVRRVYRTKTGGGIA